MPVTAGQRFGKYELLAPLAQGGTAEIFLARVHGEAGFEKFVVIKRLLEHLAEDRSFVEMFLDEARLGSQLDHSNIVQTLELGQEEGRYYMALEYLAGLTVATLARRSQERLPRGVPVEVTLGILLQACAGLHYAHERTLADGTPLRIVHRDISPQNLVVTFEGMLKIVDFGIAHATAEARDAHTQAGFIKGKFAYMSPEQALGQPFDRRTDVFALGTIAHELLTGRRLFRRDSTYKTYQAIVNHEVPRPSEVNPELDAATDDVVLTALAHRPDDRYPTAEVFGEALAGLLHRRGRHGAAAEVGRFLDRHFQDEMADHERQLSELIAGQTRSLVLETPWDAEPGSDSLEQETRVDTAPSAPPPAAQAMPTVGLRVTPAPAPVPAPVPAVSPKPVPVPPPAKPTPSPAKPAPKPAEPAKPSGPRRPTIAVAVPPMPSAKPAAPSPPAPVPVVAPPSPPVAPVLAPPVLPAPPKPAPLPASEPAPTPTALAAIAGIAPADPHALPLGPSFATPTSLTQDATSPARALPPAPPVKTWLYPVAFAISVGVGFGLMLLVRTIF